MEIAAALRRELGDSHRAIKTVMKWTGVSESTAKNWMGGNHGPAGEHLIELIRRSEEVVSSVLYLSHRNELRTTVGLQETRERLLIVLHQIDGLLSAENATQKKTP